MHIDAQPLVVAIAALVVSLTPVAVAWTNIQLQLLRMRVDRTEQSSVVQHATLGAKVDALAMTVRSTASTTQEQVRSEREDRQK
jgi:hypothetical protein